MNDLLEYDVGAARWTDLHRSGAVVGSAPSCRSSHACTAVGTSLWVFGGEGAGRKLLGDVHTFDTVTMKWRAVPLSSDSRLPGLRK